MSNRRVGLLMMIIGILAVTAGLGLGGYNLWDSRRAGIQADAALDAIARYREEIETANLNEAPVTFPEPPPGISPDLPPEVFPGPPPDYDRELPALEVDNRQYIGTVSIPAIGVVLPVQEDWSLALLKASPCRYMGSPYEGNLIICAHNYAVHFGRLKNLLPGDEVLFTDLEGTEFRYIVAELETLAGTAVEEMESGTWDLTLFTCTLGGQTRITVRCDLLENGMAADPLSAAGAWTAEEDITVESSV